MNSGAAFSQIRRVRDLERRCFFSARWRGDRKINEKLRGHYQYYGVTDNTREVKRFRDQTVWLLYKWLNRRSQRKSYTVDTFFDGLLRTFPIIEPTIKVSLFYR